MQEIEDLNAPDFGPYVEIQLRRLGVGKPSGRKAREADVRAVVSVLDAVDRQGDIITRGALATSHAMVSEWNHSALKGEDPVGRAELWEEGDRIFALIYFDDDEKGRATCARTQALLPDWSIGYHALEFRDPTLAEELRGARRVITRVHVGEVSPVDKGATTGSGTLEACCGACAISGATAGKCAGEEGCCGGCAAAAVEDAPPPAVARSALFTGGAIYGGFPR